MVGVLSWNMFFHGSKHRGGLWSQLWLAGRSRVEQRNVKFASCVRQETDIVLGFFKTLQGAKWNFMIAHTGTPSHEHTCVGSCHCSNT